ncbi:MAG: hypothetical protein ABSH29_27020, partial [Acidimicrobiales bacterium]
MTGQATAGARFVSCEIEANPLAPAPLLWLVLGLHKGRGVGDRLQSLHQRGELAAAQAVDEVPAHLIDVVRCSAFEASAPSRGQPRKAAASVGGTARALDEPG